jgi:hypothetical protein
MKHSRKTIALNNRQLVYYVFKSFEVAFLESKEVELSEDAAVGVL